MLGSFIQGLGAKGRWKIRKKFWLESLEGKRPLGRPRYSWEGNIKAYLRKFGFGFIWLRKGPFTVSCEHVMSLRIPLNAGNSLLAERTVSFSVSFSMEVMVMMKIIILVSYCACKRPHFRILKSYTIDTMPPRRCRATSGCLFVTVLDFQSSLNHCPFISTGECLKTEPLFFLFQLYCSTPWQLSHFVPDVT